MMMFLLIFQVKQSINDCKLNLKSYKKKIRMHPQWLQRHIREKDEFFWGDKRKGLFVAHFRSSSTTNNDPDTPTHVPHPLMSTLVIICFWP